MPTTVTKLTREHVESFLADLQGKVKPSSVAVRCLSPKQLFRWRLDAREITGDPMANMKPPHARDRA
jgi:hypothetical protein